MAQQEDVRDRQARAAENQALFREVNERVKDVNDRFHAYTSLSDWVCECANDACVQRIEMTGQEYEKVRSAGERFFVAPSEAHLWPDVERVLERRENYWIVVKIGLAAEVASAADPRADDHLGLQT